MLAFDIDFWHWWVLAALLLTLEMVIPGFFFLWLSVAAGIVGIWVLALPEMDWHWQVFLFAAHVVVAVILWRKFAPSGAAYESDRPNLNQRGAAYIGRTFVLEKPISGGRGVIKVDDSRWKVECEEDLPAGSKVRVTGWDGTLLKVEAAESPTKPHTAP